MYSSSYANTHLEVTTSLSILLKKLLDYLLKTKL